MVLVTKDVMSMSNRKLRIYRARAQTVRILNGQQVRRKFNRIIRGHPFITFAKFSGFWTPPLFAVSRNLSVLSFAKLATSFTPPLSGERNKWIAPDTTNRQKNAMQWS